MPTRKTSKKPGGPIRAIYGIAIHDCMKRGNAAEMKKLAAQARNVDLDGLSGGLRRLFPELLDEPLERNCPPCPQD